MCLQNTLYAETGLLFLKYVHNDYNDKLKASACYLSIVHLASLFISWLLSQQQAMCIPGHVCLEYFT